MRRHLVFPEYGRLGNQLFQYFGLCAARTTDETVHLVGFASLAQGFTGLDCLPIWTRSVSLGIFSRLLRWASSTRFSVDLEARGQFSQPLSRGIPRVVRRAYFQTPSVLDVGGKSSVDFSEDVYRRAHEVLLEVGVSGTFSFVHVRTGDYARWPSLAAPAVLPAAWIEWAANALRQNTESKTLIVLGDDFADSLMVAEGLQALHVHESEAVDMCIMSMAQSGVLSASTFALWGANFARSRNGAPGPWYAPRFWGGVRLNRWYPENLIVDWLTYLPVDDFLADPTT